MSLVNLYNHFGNIYTDFWVQMQICTSCLYIQTKIDWQIIINSIRFAFISDGMIGVRSLILAQENVPARVKNELEHEEHLLIPNGYCANFRFEVFIISVLWSLNQMWFLLVFFIWMFLSLSHWIYISDEFAM